MQHGVPGGEFRELREKGDSVLPQRQNQKYEEFFESTANNGILETKTTIMIQLAAAFSFGCYP